MVSCSCPRCQKKREAWKVMIETANAKYASDYHAAKRRYDEARKLAMKCPNANPPEAA